MIEGLEGQSRLVLSAKLAPVVGSTFQPTGFPDLGAAEFQRPIGDGSASRMQPALLVESVQSLANHFESVGWDAGGDRPVATIARLPYVEVRDPQGRFLTSSRLEPHRLAGAYIKQAEFEDRKMGAWMIDRIGVQKGVPLDWREIYGAIFQLDPLCLIHGLFFSDPGWRDYGNPKVRRALTAVIEAHDAQPVVSGGVKRDDVYPTSDKGRGAKEGFGFVPFGRTEYTAHEIELSVAVDLEQLRGYGLAEAESDLLTAISLWEVRTLLDSPLRLRTACDLEVTAPVEVRHPDGYQLPGIEELKGLIGDLDVKFDTEVARTAIYA